MDPGYLRGDRTLQIVPYSNGWQPTVEFARHPFQKASLTLNIWNKVYVRTPQNTDKEEDCFVGLGPHIILLLAPTCKLEYLK